MNHHDGVVQFIHVYLRFSFNHHGIVERIGISFFQVCAWALRMVMETKPNFQENTVCILDLRKQFFLSKTWMTRTSGGPWLRKHKSDWKIQCLNKWQCTWFFSSQPIVPEQESNIQMPHQQVIRKPNSFSFNVRSSGPYGH